MAGIKKQCCAVALLGLLLLFFVGSGCVNNQNGAGGTAKIEANVQSVKGKVQKISPAEGIMVVAPPKGDRVTVQITSQTPVKGGNLAEITRFQPVRVMYTVEGAQNRSTSIEILPQGSCSDN